MKKIFFSAGDVSADIYVAGLIEKLRNDYAVYGYGGKKMRKAGCVLLQDMVKHTAFGVTEIITKLFYFKNLLNQMDKDLKRIKPDLFVAVDFGGFNLKALELAKKRGIKTIYLIPPKLWAWGEKRVKYLKETKLIAIFPFEEEYYKERGIKCVYAGNPLVSSVRPSLTKEEFEKKFGFKDYCLILPGSRKQEIKKHASVLKKACALIKEKKVIVSSYRMDIEGASFFRPSDIKEYKYDFFANCSYALAKSGTNNLELALCGAPAVIFYKVSFLSFLIMKAAVKIKYISLPNIISNKEIYPELIQNDFTALNIISKISYLKKGRNEMQSLLKDVKINLGDKDFYKNAVKEIKDEL